MPPAKYRGVENNVQASAAEASIVFLAAQTTISKSSGEREKFNINAYFMLQKSTFTLQGGNNSSYSFSSTAITETE